ncbi:hypothetical protein PPTG_09063 [Phytophthora nicotianae INRA-310]|uniref:Myb/SANT-like domain-containing protein n=1 Tax=Phytophthora nicotianae (strain INRA-310) TaxID=761204 RepID=W2QHY6_PHYN3|nr:hypothetical protein PPTG_09063 [Phytophthora nicotianae INRA-310]ETN12164.1 hypothetical protein PPTG_09063 [Phytophthora nicotianae INRA-310]
MVFRFKLEHDQELMRELIRLKPFSAKRGTTGHVWEEVAKGVSSAIQVQLNVKQVPDRLNLLKAKFKADELSSARAIGVEEDLHAVNIRSHYNDLNGLVRDYIELERMYLDEKKAKKSAKTRKEEDLANSAAALINESKLQRSQRPNYDTERSSSDERSSESKTESIASLASAVPSQVSTSSRSTPKRSNAFLDEVKRQAKRHKEQIELKTRELEQHQHQFEARLQFEKQQAEERLRSEECIQAGNRELLLQCAKLFSAATARPDNPNFHSDTQ